MLHAGDCTILASEEIFLALRPRNFRFEAVKVGHMEAFRLRHGPEVPSAALPESQITNSVTSELRVKAEELLHYEALEEEERQREDSQLLSSMASSYSSELHSISMGGETDESDIEWITPAEAALIQQQNTRPVRATRLVEYSDFSDISRNSSRGPSVSSRGPSSSSKASQSSRRRGWRKSLPKVCLLYARGVQSWLRKATSTEGESLREKRADSSLDEANDNLDASARLEAAARRVDRMLQVLFPFSSHEFRN